MSEPQLIVHADRELLGHAAGARLVLSLLDAGTGVGEPAGSSGAPAAVHVALTGGGMGSAILTAAGRSGLLPLVDWSRVHFWWGDERYLATGDPDRNETQARAALLDHLVAAHALPEVNIHPIAGPDRSPSPEASAAAYGGLLQAHGTGRWQLVLLGMGPDGHVASLFPHHPAQRITNAIAVAVHESPKPPPTRVSLTYECLERAAQVWFLVAGADKADAVCRALTPGTDRWDVPAVGVRGQETTLWLVDAEAAHPAAAASDRVAAPATGSDPAAAAR